MENDTTQQFNGSSQGDSLNQQPRMQALQEAGKQRLHDLQETSKSYVEAGRDYLNKAIGPERTEELKAKSRQLNDLTCNSIREHPLRSVAIGLVAGLMLGRVFRR